MNGLKSNVPGINNEKQLVCQSVQFVDGLIEQKREA